MGLENILSFKLEYFRCIVAQSARAVEYIDCFSIEE